MVSLCLLNPLRAGQFGNFTYTDNGTSITITDYPTTAVGPVMIPASISGKPVTAIGKYAFESCSRITSVDIPSSITSLGDGTFSYCGSLETVTNIANITAIPYMAFYKYTKLTSAAIPPTVTFIGTNAFRYCNAMTDLIVPNGVAIINDSAFADCISLTSVTLPSSLDEIGNAFSGCSNLLSISVAGGNPNFSSSGGVLFDKSQTLLIASPGGLTGSLAIPPSVTAIRANAFSLCRKLTSVSIPTGMTTIGDWAFSFCSGLTSLTIPATVTSTGRGAFVGCSGLESVTISPNMSHLESALFSSCSGLTSVTIPPGATSMGSLAFYGCSKLSEVIMPSGMASIGEQAFAGCASISRITIPSGLTSIGEHAFAECKSMEEFIVEATNPNFSSHDGVIFNKSKSKLILYPIGKVGSYTVPDGVSTIERFAFAGSSRLSGITIPPSVASIEHGAFSSCSILRSITIPGSVNSIAENAFSGCIELRSACFLGDAPTTIGLVDPYGNRVFPPSTTVYYFNGATGFTSPTWLGFPSVNMGEFSFIAPWLLTNGLPYNADVESDPNLDGVNLLTAYSLNLNPNLNLAGSLPRPVIIGGEMSLTFHAGSPGVTYKVETSRDLLNWSTLGVSLSVPDANNLRTATVSTTDPSRYLRLVTDY